MRTKKLLALAVVLGGTTLATVATGPAAHARFVAPDGPACISATHDDAASARGGRGVDHRDVSLAERRQIARETKARLRAQGLTRAEIKATTATIPVYVHVMAAEDGTGDVTDAQIDDQIEVLNASFGGEKSRDAADTGFSFTLAGVDRYFNDTWHLDRGSAKYRKATRQGGANALNIWLVDFKYLGIATFPWDYEDHPGTDGIRVAYNSLPGGDIEDFNLGETATHEAGHWLGLFHTFEGGCAEVNDEVADTPAQSGPTSGCPEGRDSCDLPGLDPIHNFMDYSIDSCYTEFTPGQAIRMHSMWLAYRA